MTKILYSRKEAAAQLSLSVATLDRYIAANEIRVRRIGRSVRVPHGELIRFSRMDHAEVDA